MGIFDFLTKKDPRAYIPPTSLETPLLLIRVFTASIDEKIHFVLVEPDGKTHIDPMKMDPRLLFLGMAIIERMAIDPSWTQVAHFSPVDMNAWSIKAADNRSKNDPLAYQHALEDIILLKSSLQNERDKDVQ
jgi:hypothetical protein